MLIYFTLSTKQFRYIQSKPMKTILLAATLSLCAAAANATNYYFAANGDDARTATQASNPATPWRTISKFNAIANTLRPGDTVFFKRGDTFTGNLRTTNSGTAAAPIVITAYGSGAKPVLSGFKTLSGWVAKGNGVFEITDSELPTRINMVTVNGTSRGMGRWPNADAVNKGYMNIDAATTNTITDNELTSAINWTGAELVARTSHWTLDRLPITAHSGSTLTFGAGATYTPKVKYGYFIQNDIRTFDQVGEWAYNTATKKFSMFFGANNPASYTVKASVSQDVITIFDDDHYLISDLVIEGANENGIDIYSCEFIRLQDCDVQNNGRNGYYASQSGSLLVEDNNFNYNANMGMQFPLGDRNITIRNNRVRNTAMIAGMGQPGGSNYTAINVNATNAIVEQNVVENTGYAGIRFDGDYVTVKNNLIQYFSMVMGDVGGIYTWGDGGHVGRKVLNNIILDGYGAKEGTQYTSSLHASGIYLDDNAKNIEVSGNTVARCGRNGIYMHNNQNIILKENTFYDNIVTQLNITHDDTAKYAVRGIDVKNNIFFAKDPTEKTSIIQTKRTDISLFGVIDSNFYLRPVDELNTISATTNLYTSSAVTSNYSLAQWVSAYGYDRNSRRPVYTFPKTTKTDSLYFFEYNASLQAKTVSLPGLYTDARGNNYNGSIVLQPYTSAALIKIGNLVTLPVATLTAPAASTSFDAPASIRIAATATDPDGIARVEFYNGTTLLGTDTTAPYEWNWNNVTPGNYDLSVKAFDTKGQVGVSATNSIRVVNSNPVISLTSPAGASSFDAPAVVTIAANASDSDGVDRVEFYNGSTLLASDSTAPYTFNWTNVLPGSYAISAKAVDVKGYSTTTTVATISVINSTPVISLTSPVANTLYDAPASIQMSADASDNDGVARVEFYNGSNLLATDNTAPYAFTWNNVVPGTYTLSAKVYDVKGYVATSALNAVQVINSNPDVVLTSPAPGAQADAPATINITATATDADGIARVEFYNGTTLLATDNTAPYTFNWTNVMPGSYAISVKAIDVKGYSTISDTAAVTVINSNPLVSLTAPATGTTTDAPATIRIAADANDQDGIARVEFYNGAVLLGTDSSAPFEYLLNNVQPGTYTFSVKAVDVKGYTSTSATAAVTVVNSNPEVVLTAPASGSNLETPASVRIAANASDVDGIARVEFYQGTTLLATDNSAPYEFMWTSVAPGTYTISARAIDVKGYTTTTPSTAITMVNAAPVVALTSPVAGSSFQAPATVVVAANASDADGIARVEFLRNGVVVNTDSVAPYGFTWTNAAGGTYSFTARAIDTRGLATTSAAASITIAGDKPIVKLTSPVANAIFTAPGSVRLTATASDADGIQRVEFYQGTTLLITEKTAPYDQTWSNVAAGTYTVQARAYDKLGNMTLSNVATITVKAPVLTTTNTTVNTTTQTTTTSSQPVVTLTSPLNGAVYNAPASFTLSANASDADGISKVEFYQGNKLIDVEYKAPYTFNYAKVPAGNYTFTAKAYDKKGQVTTSTAISVVVRNTLMAIGQSSALAAIWEAPAAAKLYPNPATSMITVQLGSQLNGNTATLSIVDMQGKVVLQRSVNISGNSLPVDITALSKGSYILTLTNNMEKVNLKFIKQ